MTERHINDALRLSPRDTFAFMWFYLVGVAKFQLRAYGEAVSWFRRSIEANRNYPNSHFLLAAALAHLSDLEDAHSAVVAGLALNPGFTLRRYRAYIPSSNPIYLNEVERICAGMLMAGVPEE